MYSWLYIGVQFFFPHCASISSSSLLLYLWIKQKIHISVITYKKEEKK